MLQIPFIKTLAYKIFQHYLTKMLQFKNSDLGKRSEPKHTCGENGQNVTYMYMVHVYFGLYIYILPYLCKMQEVFHLRYA